MMEEQLRVFKPERREGESKEDYQLRRKAGQQFNKLNAKGVMFWDSYTNGTFKKVKVN